MARSVKPAFTLIELLIVVAIIALLVSILLPSLAAAREMANGAICASNLRSVYLAATFYANDFDGWLTAPTMSYFTGTAEYAGNIGLFVAPRFSSFNNFRPHDNSDRQESGPADYYFVMEYIPYTTRNYQGVPGNDLVICPILRDKRGPEGIWLRYTSNNGNVENHYGFSQLLYGYYRYSGPADDRVRTNACGPWKPEELADVSKSVFSFDGMVFGTDVYPKVSDAVSRDFSIGERSTCFGAIVVWATSYLDDPPYYHQYGPQASHWDGHVEAYTPPPLSQHTAMRKQFSRDGMGW
jgi:prepilin-type N-terminal cleavage/methylation domain-containing protein